MIHEMKLLSIHKRRLEIMEQQKAIVGAHYSATLIMEIDEVKKQMAELEAGLKRRLQALREKAAVYGLNVDPAITIEIEDIEGYFDPA